MQSKVSPRRVTDYRPGSSRTDTRKVIKGIQNHLGVARDESVLAPYGSDRVIAGLGDPNLHKYRKIEPAMADSWKTIELPYSLSAQTRALARELDYQIPT